MRALAHGLGRAKRHILINPARAVLTAHKHQIPQLIATVGLGLGLTLLAESILTAAGANPLGMVWSAAAFSSLPFTLGSIYAAVWLHDSELGDNRYVRIAAWFAGGIAVSLGINLLLMLGLPPDSLFQAVSWVRWGSSLGGGVGLAIGIFEAQGIERAVDAERERIRAEAAESEEELLEYLNATLRHEVLNAATVLNLHADLIRQECTTDTVADRAETIIARTSEMEQVIKDVRLLVQASKSQNQADAETIDITAVLADEIAELKQADVPVSVEASLPERALVEAGAPIRHVFANLFWNAVKHADDTTPNIEVSLRCDTNVTITVADAGPGVPADERATLFEHEPRDDASHGLDLVLSQTLVEGYGGTLELTETGPDGTTFTVTLPRALATEASNTATTQTRTEHPDMSQ